MKNKTLMVLLSLVIAFGLWAYVVTVEAPESEKTYYNVPVVLDGQNLLAERNLMIVSKQDLKVNLTLSGYRTDLNKLDNTNITLVADLSKIMEPGEHRIHYTVSYPGSQTGTIHTVEKDPQFIEISVVELSKKEIPVKPTYAGTLPDGYIADRQNVTLDHTTVTISGPKDLVDRIDQAKITVNLDGQKSTITQVFPITLCDKDGEPVEDVSSITVNVSDVRANVIIRKLKDVPLRLEIIPGGGIDESMITVTMDRDSVTVSGSEAALEDLDEILLGTIDLGELSGNKTQFFEIILPDGVVNVTGISTVLVKVELPTMDIKSFIVTTFEAINVPEGAEIDFKTEQIIVDVRGPAALLERLRPEDIVAVVDFAGAQPGSATYEATIRIRMTGVGAIGRDYTVSAVVIVHEQPEKVGD